MRGKWSKGHTKETHASVKKISLTMKSRKIDNFKKWRDSEKKAGRIKSYYPEFERNGDLAELIGVILGDGHIAKFPRTDRVLIFSDARKAGFVHRYANLVEKIFKKKPRVYKLASEECIRIDLYEKNISKRLSVPHGARLRIFFSVPRWILSDRIFTVRYLRGLYEAEGSYGVHLPTSTHKFVFSNHNQSLLKIVYREMVKLGFHPSRDPKRVQLSRKDEVKRAIELLEFRKY